jgi:hypothetical protein
LEQSAGKIAQRSVEWFNFNRYAPSSVREDHIDPIPGTEGGLNSAGGKALRQAQPFRVNSDRFFESPMRFSLS